MNYFYFICITFSDFLDSLLAYILGLKLSVFEGGIELFYHRVLVAVLEVWAEINCSFISICEREGKRSGEVINGWQREGEMGKKTAWEQRGGGAREGRQGLGQQGGEGP